MEQVPEGKEHFGTEKKMTAEKGHEKEC